MPKASQANASLTLRCKLVKRQADCSGRGPVTLEERVRALVAIMQVVRTFVSGKKGRWLTTKEKKALHYLQTANPTLGRRPVALPERVGACAPFGYLVRTVKLDPLASCERGMAESRAKMWASSGTRTRCAYSTPGQPDNLTVDIADGDILPFSWRLQVTGAEVSSSPLSSPPLSSPPPLSCRRYREYFDCTNALQPKRLAQGRLGAHLVQLISSIKWWPHQTKKEGCSPALRGRLFWQPSSAARGAVFVGQQR